MSDQITITHDSASGTLATGDTRPYAASMKASGWRWSRSITAWYIPNSRDRLPQQWKIDRTVAALEAAGATVTVEIDAELAPMAEREERRAERIEARQEALAAKADRLQATSDAHHAKVDAIVAHIPFGQPILVGHHSEARARRDQQRIWDGMDKAVATWKEAEETSHKAEASVRHQKHRGSGPATMRRLERLHTEQRDVTRKMEQAEAAGKQEWFDRLHVINLDLTDQIIYWANHLEDLKAQGWKQWGPADFKPGDLVMTKWFHGARKVVRVNKKSLSVETGYSWTDKVTWDDIGGKIAAEDLAQDGGVAAY